MHVIRTFYSPEEAYTALSLLQAHGLDAQILDSATLSILPLDSVALGGYRLAVFEHQAEAGLALLDNPQPISATDAPPQYFDDDDQEAQPQSRPQLNKKLLIIASLALFIFLLIVQGGR